MTQAQLLAVLYALDGWDTQLLHPVLDQLFFGFLRNEGYGDVVVAYMTALRRIGVAAKDREVLA